MAGRAVRIDGPVIVGSIWDVACCAALVTGVTVRDAMREWRKLWPNNHCNVERSESASMVGSICIMTGATTDGCTSNHVIAVSLNGLTIMPRQNIADLRSMTKNTASVRGGNQSRSMLGSSRTMTPSTASFLSEDQVRTITILIDSIARNFRGVGMDKRI